MLTKRDGLCAICQRPFILSQYRHEMIFPYFENNEVIRPFVDICEWCYDTNALLPLPLMELNLT